MQVTNKSNIMIIIYWATVPSLTMSLQIHVSLSGADSNSDCVMFKPQVNLINPCTQQDDIQEKSPQTIINWPDYPTPGTKEALRTIRRLTQMTNVILSDLIKNRFSHRKPSEVNNQHHPNVNIYKSRNMQSVVSELEGSTANLFNYTLLLEDFFQNEVFWSTNVRHVRLYTFDKMFERLLHGVRGLMCIMDMLNRKVGVVSFQSAVYKDILNERIWCPPIDKPKDTSDKEAFVVLNDFKNDFLMFLKKLLKFIKKL